MKKVLHKLKHPHSASTDGDEKHVDSEASSTSGTLPRKSTDQLNGSRRASTDLVSSSRASPRASVDRHRASTDRHRPSVDHHRPSHSPIGVLREKLGRKSVDHGDGTYNRDGDPMSKNQLRKQDRDESRERRKKDAAYQRAEEKRRKEEAERKALENETDEQRTKYGFLDPNVYAGQPKGLERVKLAELSEKDIGKSVIFRARIHNIRKISAHMCFIELRQQTVTIQGVLHEHANVSAHFIYWAEHLHNECVVLVSAVIQEPKAKQGEVIGASIHKFEVSIHEMFVEGNPTDPLPFSVMEAEVSNQEAEGTDRHRVSDRARMSNRIVDLRTTSSQSIFRVQSAVSSLFREALLQRGFIEIHTPKLQGGATESGASVFKLDYFGRPAFLAQSPQLAKQMCIASDFGRVFEIGAVFRAENSNTHRHMTEYTGLDLEMTIDEHYHEVLRTLDAVFKNIFKGIYERCRAEIDILKRQFPHEDLVWIEKTPIIKFSDGIKMLNGSGWTQEDGKPLPEDEDLGTRDEIQLGKLVKEKYGTDYYVLDKFPRSARPFYTMPDPQDPKYTNSFDIFCRGQEILSGGQRIHDAKMLKENLDRQKIDPTTMEEYLNGFEWGAPPHGGGGIGLERLLMLMLGLGDIRHATLFPRDPRSLPARPAVKPLRHPESSTLHPPWEGQDRVAAHMEYQPLENLIANYGDASNTSWLEPRTEIWRDEQTGAAIGFVPQGDYAITVGDPLCHAQQYQKTIGGYLRYIKKERGLKPIWVLCGGRVEEALAAKHDWRTFSVAAEQRVDLSSGTPEHDADIQKKIRHSEKEGVKIQSFAMGEPPSEEIRVKVDQRVKDWLANRKGKQVHLTDVHPWQDMAHRAYHIAYDKDGQICCMIIMAILSPEHGWQVKFSLDFPGAPSGAIEASIVHALKAVTAGGDTNVTFGGGATSNFTPGHNLGGARVKVLAKAYTAIATELKLINKSEFREKLGAQGDPIYVCYPPHGLGPGGARAILNFFGDD